MKKTMKTMLAFVAGALALSACNNEDAILNDNVNDNDNGAKLVTLTAYQEGEGGTRAAIDATDSKKIDWTSGDQINYFGGAPDESMTLKTGAGTTSATFEGSVTSGSTDYVLYPYQSTATNNAGVITAEVPMTQYAVANSFDPKAALMVGPVNAGSVEFKNVMSYVKVTIPTGMSCKQVVLKAKDAWTTVAGKVNITASTGAWAETTNKEGQAFVRLVPQEGSTTLTAGASYYIAILPQTMDTGFELIFNDNDVIKVKQASSSVEFGRSKTKKLAAFSDFTYTVGTVAVGEGATAFTMADRNIGVGGTGTTVPTGTDAYGDYFAWGALRPAYKTKAGSVSEGVTTLTDLYWSDGFTASHVPSTFTDIAAMLWGGNWRMATKDEWNNNTSNSSVQGLPPAGFCYAAYLYNASVRYWSSSPDGGNTSCLCTDGSGAFMHNFDRYYGFSVRPVLAQYTKSSNWLKQESNPQQNVDVFYILPTCIMQGTNEVEYFSEQDKLTAAAIYDQQAKLFEGFCNIYAPYYRQIPINVALAECQTAEDMATNVRSRAGKDDVFAALDYYFRNLNNGRPFILASHSQGTAMMRPVLDTYMKEHPEYYSRMVACYAIGFSLPLDWFEANPHLKKATDATSTGVVIGWNTEGPQATTPSLLIGSNDYVINPLSWKCDGEWVSETQNLGSLIDGQVIPGYADAQIDLTRRALICTTDINYVDVPAFGDRCLHGGDWSLYWGNIQQNAKDRIAKYKEEHQLDN